MSVVPVIRVMRPAVEPLGLFFRPGHIDHRVLLQLLSEGRSSMAGVVFDPSHLGAQEELRTEVLQRRLWAVLDTRMMELATANGHTKRRAELPWASSEPHRPQELSGAAGRAAAGAVVNFMGRYGFNAAIVGHYLERGASDTWFAVDVALLRDLRRQLDSAGHEDFALYYALAVPTSIFHDASQIAAIKASLRGLDIDGLWLRIHPFGSASGHITLQRFVRACRNLHELNLPLVVEKAGSIGLALLAFGAVSGLESGVSSGDKFDYARLVKPAGEQMKPFGPHARVYIPDLGIFLNRDSAQAFFSNRSLKANYGCQNTACCRRGTQDTLSDPRRHFIFTRMEEVGAISQVPERLRPNQYLDNILRPATDRLGRVLQAGLSSDVTARIEKERRKLDGWRHTLGEMSRNEVRTATWAVSPVRRVAHRRGA
jgi:hypothetical protein